MSLISVVFMIFVFLFFFKQKTAYEMRISDWSSDVCSSDLADPTNDDAACAPIDPFGNVKASQAALDYATVLSGSHFENVQDDVLATLGGDLFKLPGGLAKFSVAYEHRRDYANLVP